MSSNDGRFISNTETNLSNKIYFEEMKNKQKNSNFDKNKKTVNIKKEINKFNSKLNSKKVVIRRKEQTIIDNEQFRIGN